MTNLVNMPPDPHDAAPGVSIFRAPSTWLYLMLGLGGSGYLWFWIEAEAMTASIVSGLLGVLALAGIVTSTRARRLAATLRATRTIEQTIAAHRPAPVEEAKTGAGLRHISAWLVAILGICAVVLMWQADSFTVVLGEYATVSVGLVVVGMLALVVAANSVNVHKSKRLVRDLREARQGEKFALDTLRSVDVMISACLPGGDRTEFNKCYIDALGRTFEELQGKGWQEAVHADDRPTVLDTFTRPMRSNETRRQHDLCMRKKNGDFLWLRETVVPRYDEQGMLVEFICTAIDVTTQVNNESSQDERIEKLTKELTELRDEHSKTKTSRNRFQKNLDEAREDLKNTSAALDQAEAKMDSVKQDAKDRIAQIEEATEGRITKLKDEASSSKQQFKQSQIENRKLNQAYEKLQDEVTDLRHEEIEHREKVTRHLKEVRQAKAELTEAQAREATQRAKITRLTQHVEDLEEQLEGLEQQLGSERSAAEKQQDRQASAAAAAQSDAAGQALAGELRKHLEGAERMMSELHEAALDGPPRDALHNTAATIRSMTQLVEHALGGETITPIQSGRADSFSLQDTMDGVGAMVADDAENRGVSLDIKLSKNMPALLHGDETALRSALRSIIGGAINLVEDGTLTANLTKDVSTAAHTTVRCELSHGGAKVTPDVLEREMALDATDDDMPDAIKHPTRHQAAQAWRVLRGLDGTHGFQNPDQGGFSIWFTFTVGRPGAAATMKEDVTPVQVEEIEEIEPVQATEESAPADVEPPKPAQVPSRPKEMPSIPPMSDDRSGASNGPKPRVPVEFLACNLGDVAELGGEGMVVHCTKSQKKDQVVTITFPDLEDTIELRAAVEWCRKGGSRKYEVCLTFAGAMPDLRKKVMHIAMQHRKVTTMLGLD